MTATGRADHAATFAIFDDVLDDDQALALWAFFQQVPLTPVGGGLEHAWRRADGTPLAGPHHVAYPAGTPPGTGPGAPAYPTGTAMDAVVAAVLARADRLEPWIGRAGLAWSHLTFTPWVYPSGTSLGWHSDGTAYHGAFVFYAHPEWNVEWGGELLIAEPPAIDPADREPAHRFDNRAHSDQLLAAGRGHFVSPKPNRLVVIAPHAPHRIAPVTAAAGHNVRASIGGFFTRRRAGT